MGLFNTSSRTKNTVKSSLCGSICNLINLCLGFGYRIFFLKILSEKYLGINGLFSNVLQVLSLAEMGITTAIVYRFYEPIKNNNVEDVGRLMNFFKSVYRNIAIIIMIIGLALVPFVNKFVKDASEIPADIDIQMVYILFLFNTVSSYLFVYKQTLLSADQKNYLISLFQMIASVVRYMSQIIVLFISKNYMLTLAIVIIVTLLINYGLSLWITYIYKPVFGIKERLREEDRKKIFNDTKACLFHKIGSTVKLSTDSIVLSKFVSLSATGLYSNYSLIISSLQNVLSQLLGNFVSSIGNAHASLSKEENYKIYRRLLFGNLWITVVFSGCLFLLINDFICLWLGEKYQLDQLTVVMLCAQFYIIISRQINISYTNGCGLFVKDKIRPLVEATLNLIISISLSVYLGIAGVFIGTVISSLLTICWREPIILFKYEFDKPVREYWKEYCQFLLCCIITCVMFSLIKTRISIPVSVFWWILEALAYFALFNIILLVLFHKREEYKSLFMLIKKNIENLIERFLTKNKEMM